MKFPTDLSTFLGKFCRTTLPWYYLSRLERLELKGGKVYYSDGVLAGREGSHRVIRRGDFILRRDDDLFVPALWNEPQRQIIAYSERGYRSTIWKLPHTWVDVKTVDVSNITTDGLQPVQSLNVDHRSISLSLNPNQAVVISPRV